MVIVTAQAQHPKTQFLNSREKALEFARFAGL